MLITTYMLADELLKTRVKATSGAVGLFVAGLLIYGVEQYLGSINKETALPVSVSWLYLLPVSLAAAGLQTLLLNTVEVIIWRALLRALEE